MSTSGPLVARANAVSREVQARLQTAVEEDDGTAQLLATGSAEIRRALAAIERDTVESCRSFQLVSSVRTMRAGAELNRRSTSRGIALDTIASPDALVHNPLIAARESPVWIGPVRFPGFVIDDRVVAFAGPLDAWGRSTVWSSRDSTLVAGFLELWTATQAASTLLPRLTVTARQWEVIDLLLDGTAESRIARHLGVSVRTVSHEVAALCALLGVSGRPELIARLSTGALVTPR